MYNHKKITYLIYPKSVVIWTMIDEIQRLKMHILRIYFYPLLPVNAEVHTFVYMHAHWLTFFLVDKGEGSNFGSLVMNSVKFFCFLTLSYFHHPV